MFVFTWLTVKIEALGLAILLIVTFLCYSEISVADSVHYHAAIASYNPRARNAAKGILKSGGNAFDAFVAATLVEFVVSPGVTSMAGSLAAMIYDAKTSKTVFLDSTYNIPTDSKSQWSEGDNDAKSVLIPGAIKGLEAISKRFGKLSFAKACEPAILIAKQGFTISPAYAAILLSKIELLKKSEYGRQTFFQNGKPLAAGTLLRLPKVAQVLEGIAANGSHYFYLGPWARDFESGVRAAGGFANANDLSAYKIHWLEPRKISYRGYDVHFSSGRTFGALWEALALKTFEHTTLNFKQHYSTNAKSLGFLIRIARAIWAEDWLTKPKVLDDTNCVQAKLTFDYH